MTTEEIKLDKSILNLIKQENMNGPVPLYSQTLINFYRAFTIAIKDIIWEEPDFKSFLNNDKLQFLKNLRHASAHSNKFYLGRGKERTKTISKLPISWRGKVIEEKLEGTKLYFDFMKPGDLFLLLSDISELIK